MEEFPSEKGGGGATLGPNWGGFFKRKKVGRYDFVLKKFSTEKKRGGEIG